MSYCSNCGQKIDNKAKFCSNCGSLLKKGNNLNVKIIKCPNCDADIEYRTDKDNFKCQYCGADVVIDDEATELNRVLNAKMNAQKREMEMNIEYENHQQALDAKKNIIEFFMSNPVLSVILVLFLVHAVLNILKGHFAPIHIIIYAVILGVVQKKTRR